MWVRTWLFINSPQNNANYLCTIFFRAVKVTYQQNFFVGYFFVANKTDCLNQTTFLVAEGGQSLDHFDHALFEASSDAITEMGC